MAWVWDLQLSPGEKLVLLAYADHADHEGGSIFPAIRTVAGKTGYSRRTVQSTTRRLEELGLLISEGEGPRGTNEYRLPLEEGGANTAPGATSQRPGGAVGAAKGAQSAARGGANTAPKPSGTAREEPSSNLFGESESPGGSPQLPVPADEDSRALRSNLDELPPVPDALLTSESWAAWLHFLNYRRSVRRRRVSRNAAVKIFRDCTRLGCSPAQFVEALELSERGDWTGVFPEKVTGKQRRLPSSRAGERRTASERSRMVDVSQLEEPESAAG